MPRLTIILRWLLPASLVLNVFLIFLCVAAILLPRLRPPHDAHPHPGSILEDLTRNLSPADAQILRDTMSDSLQQMDQAHRAHATLPQRLQDILRREPFDKAAFKEQLVQTRQAEKAADAALDDALPNAIAKISADGRRKLAEWMPLHPPPGPPPPR
jgi:uncharacterized membrane protein